jgi:pentatricopeptide repeat protein
MFEDMVNHRGLNPDEKTFTTLMQGFIEQDDLNGALKIKKQMLGYGCLLTNVSVNVLVNGFCKDGRVECRGDFRTPSYWLALALKNMIHHRTLIYPREGENIE